MKHFSILLNSWILFSANGFRYQHQHVTRPKSAERAAFMVAANYPSCKNHTSSPVLLSRLNLVSMSRGGDSGETNKKIESANYNQILKSSFLTNQYYLLNTKQTWLTIFILTILVKMIQPVLDSSTFLKFLRESFHSLTMSTAASTTTSTNIFRRFFHTIVDMSLPLLSSACCVVQLLLNAIGVGCAGFNTYLGPLRPYFVSMLLLRSLKRHPPVMKLLGAWCIALLPEVVHYMNVYRTKQSNNASNSSMRISVDHKITSHEKRKRMIVVGLQLPTMGCVACINKIDATLRSIPNVTQGFSQLNPIGKGGIGTVMIEDDLIDDDDGEFYDGDIETVTKRLVEALNNVGFPCEVEYVNLSTTKS